MLQNCPHLLMPEHSLWFPWKGSVVPFSFVALFHNGNNGCSLCHCAQQQHILFCFIHVQVLVLEILVVDVVEILVVDDRSLSIVLLSNAVQRCCCCQTLLLLLVVVVLVVVVLLVLLLLVVVVLLSMVIKFSIVLC